MPGTQEPEAGGATRFSAYGLVFDCDFPVPGVRAAPPDALADVRVRCGPVAPVPGAGPSGDWQLPGPGVAVVDWEQGRLRVAGGREVTLDLDPALHPAMAGLSLLYGAALMILHQREAAPLHAAGAAGADGAALFIGAAGAGKSTFAALLGAFGAGLVCDDLAALELDGPGLPGLHSAIRTAKLFEDSRRALERAEAEARPVTEAGEALGKGVVELARAPAPPVWPAPLRAIFALEWLHPPEAAPELDRLRPAEALARLRAAVARPELVGPLGLERAYFGRLAGLASRVPAFALRRPRSYEASGAAAALVMRELAAARRRAEGEPE